jgi:hypothetical protein
VSHERSVNAKTFFRFMHDSGSAIECIEYDLTIFLLHSYAKDAPNDKFSVGMGTLSSQKVEKRCLDSLYP